MNKIRRIVNEYFGLYIDRRNFSPLERNPRYVSQLVVRNVVEHRPLDFCMKVDLQHEHFSQEETSSSSATLRILDHPSCPNLAARLLDKVSKIMANWLLSMQVERENRCNDDAAHES